MSNPRFYGADAARLVSELELPTAVQQGILADAALTVAIRAERRSPDSEHRRSWLTLTAYMIEKEERDEHCA